MATSSLSLSLVLSFTTLPSLGPQHASMASFLNLTFSAFSYGCQSWPLIHLTSIWKNFLHLEVSSLQFSTIEVEPSFCRCIQISCRYFLSFQNFYLHFTQISFFFLTNLMSYLIYYILIIHNK